VLLLVDRHQFARRVKECGAEKAAKGFSCWGQFVAMMFGQLAQAKSLREISDGLACCEGKLNHLGLQEGPKRSTLSYANAKRPWELFEQVFYVQLGLAQSLAPKKKLRFKNKLLSLDATIIDLCLSMYNWATFRQTKGAVKLHLLLDHDGYGGEEGGIERWLVLTDALGLDRAYVVSMRGALPATTFAVEAYVRFVREMPLVDAVASSLTELFAPKIHKERIAGMLENYDFIGERAMQYFKRRLDQANRDSDFALDFVKRHATTPELQAAAIDAVRFKCNVLWAQLDALHHAYVAPGLVPPGAFRPEVA
jgi:coenzyme PQQ biosynthesis protein C